MGIWVNGDLGEWGLNLIDKGSGMSENAVLNGDRSTIHKGMYIAMCSAFGVRRSSRYSHVRTIYESTIPISLHS